MKNLFNKIIVILVLILAIIVGIIIYKYNTRSIPVKAAIQVFKNTKDEKPTIDLKLIEGELRKVGYIVCLEKDYNYKGTIPRDITKYAQWLVGRDLNIDLWYTIALGYDLKFISMYQEDNVITLTLQTKYLDIKSCTESKGSITENQASFLSGHFSPKELEEYRKLGQTECINKLQHNDSIKSEAMDNLKDDITNLLTPILKPYNAELQIDIDDTDLTIE